MNQLRLLKKAYGLLNNDIIRAASLVAAEKLGFRKDILRLDTNDLCNIECIMCTSKIKQRKETNIMPFEQYEQLIDHFAKTTRFLYLSCQYEPLMTPNFTKYMQYAKSKQIPFISLCTNGVLLNDKLVKSLVDNRINEVILSFNGYNANDYNRIMYRSNYDAFMRNIKKLTDYKKEKASPYPKIRLNTILMKSNILSFGELVGFVREYDIQSIQIRELRVNDSQNNVAEVKGEIISNIKQEELKEQLHMMMKEIYRLKEEGRELIVPEWLLTDQKIVDRKQSTKKKTCVTPYFSYWVEHDGTIKSCLYDENAVIGNYFNNASQLFKTRNEFCKKALHKQCNSQYCTANTDSSVMI